MTQGRENMTGTFTRRTIIALGLALSATAAQAQDLKPFKMGISAPVVTVLPVWLGEAGGFFAKQGLKVETVSMEGGSRGTQVLLSGEIQAMHVGLAPVVQANAQGADLRAVAASANKMPMTVFTAKKLEPALPKGIKIGISTFGSETDIALSVLLPKLGMTRNDVEITQIGGTGQRFAALVAGRIDAAPLLEPGVSQAKARGFIPVFDLSEQGGDWIFDAVVMTAPYIKANRETVLKFTRGYIEGARWGLKNEAELRKIISTRFKTQDQAVIDATVAEFRKLMPLDGRPSVEGAQNIISELAKINVPVKSRDVGDYLDLSVIGDLEKEGFLTGLNTTYGATIK
jgi:NitT/TauT family transport system substrate-binding protein